MPKVIQEYPAKIYFDSRDLWMQNGLLVYSVENCPPCIVLKDVLNDVLSRPKFQEISAAFVSFVNAEATLKFMERAGLRFMPTLFFIKEGNVHRVMHGFNSDMVRPNEHIARWISKQL